MRRQAHRRICWLTPQACAWGWGCLKRVGVVDDACRRRVFGMQLTLVLLQVEQAGGGVSGLMRAVLGYWCCSCCVDIIIVIIIISSSSSSSSIRNGSRRFTYRLPRTSLSDRRPARIVLHLLFLPVHNGTFILFYLFIYSILQ